MFVIDWKVAVGREYAGCGNPHFVLLFIYFNNSQTLDDGSQIVFAFRLFIDFSLNRNSTTSTF